jgi:uncharacterized protein YeaO (DUF488 family)
VAISIVQLGSPRAADEGLRIGTVRRPPRGVPKSEFASRNYFDVWLPMLAPSQELMSKGRASRTQAEWDSFLRAYLKEMSAPDTSRLLDVLAALSRTTNFAVGCYCEDESHCHRSMLRRLLSERGAQFT